MPSPPRVLVLHLAMLVGCANVPSAVAPPRDDGRAELLYEERPANWFETATRPARISPDGGRAVVGSPDDVRLIDLRSGRPDAATRIEPASFATFGPDGDIVVRRDHGADAGWFARTGARLDVPADAEPRWSAGGDRVAYTLRSAPDRGLFVGAAGDVRAARLNALGGRITGFTWLPDGGALLIMVVQRDDPRGGSSLMRLDAASGRIDTIAKDLDASQRASGIAAAPDGRRAYIALASAAAPVPEQRHQPDADRDLDIYEMDLATGARRAVVATPAEEFAPFVAGGYLHWTASVDEGSVVVIPMGGGGARTVVPRGILPSWRPDGRAMGFTYGGTRHADWALDFDGGMVEIDAAANATARQQPMIVGYHEDFSPVWSPDGAWIAYHSHRPPTPVSAYDSPGSTDDIYLRRPNAPTSQEIRLTDFGHEAGPPDWSPDGKRLLFTSEVSGSSVPWIVTIDPATGRELAHERLPLPPSIHGAEMAAWSPSGNEVALEERRAPGKHALWMVRTDGSNPRLVAEYPMTTYGGVDWTPDGSTLLYSALSGDRLQLFAVPAAGGVPRRITQDGENLLHPQVSPDGRFVAASRLSHRKQIWRMRLDHTQ